MTDSDEITTWLRSCFIEWPTFFDALDGIAALERARRERSVAHFQVNGLFRNDDNDACDVFFTLHLTADWIVDEGHEQERTFINAGVAVGGEYTGS